MPDYSNGKIYTIRNKINDKLIYVGSSIEIYLSKRFQKHKSQNNCYLYKYINEPINNTCWEDWYIELYEEYPCENKLQLCKRENEIIRQIATINKIGYLTDEMKKDKVKQWREENKEAIKEKSKKYHEKNRDELLAKKKEYNDKNKEYKSNYMKERYKRKKEEITQKIKEWTEKNKDFILEKIYCACGCLISRKGMKEHQMTKKHLNLIEHSI